MAAVMESGMDLGVPVTPSPPRHLTYQVTDLVVPDTPPHTLDAREISHSRSMNSRKKLKLATKKSLMSPKKTFYHKTFGFMEEYHMNFYKCCWPDYFPDEGLQKLNYVCI
ncbi:unnamed protein product [Cuscuta europaea]|uniref:Uncharacterized protein n=1 Tax=Cuscuta europaea TaxID=41803 RepID=A0A9P0YYV5_CUSEU|nr:unnamed protein product [Cuscuta europaea]